MLLWSYIGKGAFRCSLNLSQNVLAVSYIILVDFVVLEISNFAHMYICVYSVAVCMNNFDNIPSILHLVTMLVLFYKQNYVDKAVL